MAYENKPGQGTAFKNDSYKQGDKFPYCRGKVKDPTGKEWDIALWMPKSDKVKGFNVTLQEPYKKEEKSENLRAIEAAHEAEYGSEPDAGDLPF